MTCDVHLTVRRCMCFIVSARAVARNFTWGDSVLGWKNECLKATSWDGENFWNFCFEMVHFGE